MSNAPVENSRPAVILCTEIKGNLLYVLKVGAKRNLSSCVCECECVKDESQREPIDKSGLESQDFLIFTCQLLYSTVQKLEA